MMKGGEGRMPVLKGKLLRTKDFVLDAADLLMRKRRWDRPPRSLDFVGGGDFKGMGEKFVQFFADVCALTPEDHVLDVGCGVGRVAIALTRYLAPEGAYCGIDIVEPGIDWCRREIAPRAQNFRFDWANVYNAIYNPAGKVQARDFRFPYEDEAFDFVFLTSVFTHMLPEDVEHYISEIARVLKPERLCVMTWFLVNEESHRMMAAGRAELQFSYALQGCRTTNLAHPEAAVAYDEAEARGMLSRNGLALVPPIRYGRWSGRRAVRFQDVVVAKKV